MAIERSPEPVKWDPEPATQIVQTWLQGEVSRLRAQLKSARRWVPCPDHRDKTEDGRCYVCENESLRAELEEAREHVNALLASLDHLDIREGVCCCGEDMKIHADAFSAGHSPVDMGEYHHGNVMERARKWLAAPEARAQGEGGGDG